MQRPVAVAEFASYRRRADELFNEDERTAIIDLIAYAPETGDIIPHANGLRKIRVGHGNTGKRGGARVVYYYYNENYPALLVAAYAKNEKSDLTAGERQAMAEVIREIVFRWKKK